MLEIDDLAYRSKLSKITPKAKMVFGVIPLVLCLGLNSFSVSFATVLIMGVVTISFSGISPARYLRLLSIPLGFLALGTVTIIFGRYEHYTPVLVGFHLFNHTYGVTTASLLYGLRIVLRAFGAVSCMYFISVNTPMNDILGALRSFGVPDLLISLMELIYRYIFVFLEEAHRMRTAQDARLGYINFRTSVNSLGQLIGTLFLRAYIRCDKIYAALQSRGYEGEFKTVKQEYAPSIKMYVYSVLLGLILTATGLLERRFL